MPTSLPELDLAPFMAAPHSARGLRPRGPIARRLSRTRFLLSRGSRRAARTRRGGHERVARVLRAARSGAARAGDRQLAALSRLYRAWRRTHQGRTAIGASSSTSAPKSRPPRCDPVIRHGSGCADRTSGRHDCPRCSRPCSRGCARWIASGLRVLRALALGLGSAARAFRWRRAAARRSASEDHSLPRATARRRHGPRRRHAPRLGARIVRAARRRRRLAGRARRQARRRDAEARHLRHESRRDAASRDARLPARDEASRAEPAARTASGSRSRTSFIRGSTPSSRRSSCRPSSRRRRAAARTWIPTTRSSRRSATTI